MRAFVGKKMGWKRLFVEVCANNGRYIRHEGRQDNINDKMC